MKLWVIRHAKSDWSTPQLHDFDRPLNARGQRDGPQMAAWLKRQTHPATWIWTSTAARALATAQFVRTGFDLSSDQVIALDELYHASAELLLDVVRRTPQDVESVAIVAHNPGLTWLVNQLGTESVTDNLPTFGIARFSSRSSWAQWAPGCATLDLLESPKTITS